MKKVDVIDLTINLLVLGAFALCAFGLILLTGFFIEAGAQSYTYCQTYGNQTQCSTQGDNFNRYQPSLGSQIQPVRPYSTQTYYPDPSTSIRAYESGYAIGKDQINTKWGWINQPTSRSSNGYVIGEAIGNILFGRKKKRP